MNSRITRVITELNAMGLTQLLITDPRSVWYLTGISVYPHERFYGLYLNSAGRKVLFANRLFGIPQTDCEIAWYSDTDDVTKVISAVIDRAEVLGVDKDIKARFLLPLMRLNAAAGFENASFAVDITRGVKDAGEIELMRAASRANDAAMEQFKALIRPGITEKQVADSMLEIYQNLGCSGFSFEPIVSFGKNAADPHHEPDDTALREGDCVLFDVGCVKDGYCSDMTRTFYYKSVSPEAEKVYELVKRANAAGKAAVRPGARLSDIDAAARGIIEAAGYGEYFNHRLGHFIGLDVHEFGDVSAASDWVARPGMIFSVEPGIYLAGNTGVRIEDLALVTEDGCESLNSYSRELEILE